MSCIFQSHKNIKLLAIRTNGLTSTQWEKRLQQWDSHQPGTDGKEQKRERTVSRLEIIMWNEKEKDEEPACKEMSVTDLNV
jgi:hypothetical protein